MSNQYSEKDPVEVVDYGIDFSNVLASGESISAASAVLSVYTGTDAGLAAMTVSGATISGSIVRQRVQAGLDGNVYRLRVSVLTSQSRTLIGAGYIPVNDP